MVVSVPLGTEQGVPFESYSRTDRTQVRSPLAEADILDTA